MRSFYKIYNFFLKFIIFNEILYYIKEVSSIRYYLRKLILDRNITNIILYHNYLIIFFTVLYKRINILN